jgi:hypothetical protein
MSIDHVSRRLRGTGRVKTPRREFEHRDYLFMRYVEPVHNFLNGGTRFQVLKHGRNRHSGISKYPRATALAGDAFHGWAL